MLKGKNNKQKTNKQTNNNNKIQNKTPKRTTTHVQNPRIWEIEVG